MKWNITFLILLVLCAAMAVWGVVSEGAWAAWSTYLVNLACLLVSVLLCIRKKKPYYTAALSGKTAIICSVLTVVIAVPLTIWAFSTGNNTLYLTIFILLQLIALTLPTLGRGILEYREDKAYFARLKREAAQRHALEGRNTTYPDS